MGFFWMATERTGFYTRTSRTNYPRCKYINRIEYSCDFALVYDWTDDNGKKHQQCIRFQKEQGNYIWADQPDVWKTWL